MMLLVFHGKMDVAIRVNSKLVFKVSNIMLLVLHAIVVFDGIV
jgi:hypothetical protein